MKDIASRSDVQHLVDSFYEDVLRDDVIGHFFHEVINLDLAEHMPILYDFWETLLLDNMVYKRNAMLKHIELHRKSPLLPEHFDRWLSLWRKAVQSSYHGPVADQAIDRAEGIAALMQHKVQQQTAWSE